MNCSRAGEADSLPQELWICPYVAEAGSLTTGTSLRS